MGHPAQRHSTTNTIRYGPQAIQDTPSSTEAPHHQHHQVWSTGNTGHTTQHRGTPPPTPSGMVHRQYRTHHPAQRHPTTNTIRYGPQAIQDTPPSTEAPHHQHHRVWSTRNTGHTTQHRGTPPPTPSGMVHR